MNEEEAFISVIRANPEDDTPRLVYADWLDERGLSGGEYLREEVATRRAMREVEVYGCRELLNAHSRTESSRRERFEQPDMLRVTPAPFPLGWYGVGLGDYRNVSGKYARFPYQSLPNLLTDHLDSGWSWLPRMMVELTENILRYEREQLAFVDRLARWADSQRVTLPEEFLPFLRDFSIRRTVAPPGLYCEFAAEDPDFYTPVRDGWLLPFYYDMNYAQTESQLSWSLYLVPDTDYQCVVVSEPMDDEMGNTISNPDATCWCAPTFKAFVYRWWLENQIRVKLGRNPPNALTPDESVYLDHYRRTKEILG